MFTREPGLLAKVDSGNRLSVPIKLLRLVEWWNEEPVDVTVELISSPGAIRVFLATQVAAKLQEMVKQRPDASPNEAFEVAGLLSDKYRDLKLYGDGRLRFTREVAIFLGFELGDEPTLFVEAFPRGLQVYNLEHRALRIDRAPKSISLNLHLENDE